VPDALRKNFGARDAMWCRFEDERPDLPHLPAWTAGYRRDAWALALADLGVSDPELAVELGRRWAQERARRHEVFPDTLAALARLRERHALAVVTNGPSHVQRAKLAGTGLADCFDAVVISGDLGIAKPDVAIFRYALDRLGLDGAEGAMIGDNLATDIAGARAAGLRAIWIDLHGAGPPEDPEVARVETLAEAVSLLERGSRC
jgi:putative hydrolase of the HAD superfamily